MTLSVTSIIDDATQQPVEGYSWKTTAQGLLFHYGDLDDPTIPENNPPNMRTQGPHTITFSDGSTLKLPEKQWRTEFRYPYLTSTVVGSPADLIARRILPPFGDVGAKLMGGLPSTAYTSPNSFAGMNKGMGTTGERPELQIVTDWGALYMMSGNPSDVLNQGEAVSTMPCFFIDKNTGKPIDRRTYPKANCYGAGSSYHGTPWMKDSPRGFKDNYDDPLSVDLETSHAPDPGFIAGVITRDQFHLRNEQMWANYVLLNNGGVDTDGQSFITAPEQRSLAWGLNLCLSACMMTREFELHGILPPDCLPSSYFENVINRTADVVLKPMKADPMFAPFHCFRIPNSTDYAPWQQNYIMSVLARLVLNGFSKFNEYFLWGLQGVVDMSSGKTAWWPALPCVYFMPLRKPDGTYIKTWDEMVAFYVLPHSQGGELNDQMSPNQLAAVTADRFCGGNFAPDSDTTYPMGAHGVLSFALYIHQLGILDVVGAVPDLPVAYANVHRMTVNATNYYFNARNAVVFDAAKITAMGISLSPTPLAGTTNPPPTGGDIPPTGDPTMPVQFIKGSSHTITTSNPKDADGNVDPFVTGDTLSYQVLSSDDATASPDQGTIGTPTASADNLSYTASFVVPQAIGDYFLRTTLNNADGTPAKVTDFEFGVVAADITTAETSIS